MVAPVLTVLTHGPLLLVALVSGPSPSLYRPLLVRLFTPGRRLGVPVRDPHAVPPRVVDPPPVALLVVPALVVLRVVGVPLAVALPAALALL